MSSREISLVSDGGCVVGVLLRFVITVCVFFCV